MSHVFPKEGDMVPKRLSHRLNVDFSWGAAGLKKHVFINVRKQIGQKREGVSASQL